jgi:hypothetical protein
LESYVINVEKLLKEHYCPICNGVLVDPVYCRKCENLFCCDCIFSYTQSNISCFTLNCSFEESKIPAPISRILDYIELRCLNYINGCEAILRYSKFFSHIKECIFRDAKCNYCDLKLLYKELDNHISECDLAPVICDLCETGMQRKNFRLHEIKSCLKNVFLNQKTERDKFHNKILEEESESRNKIRFLVEENHKLREDVELLKRKLK